MGRRAREGPTRPDLGCLPSLALRLWCVSWQPLLSPLNRISGRLAGLISFSLLFVLQAATAAISTAFVWKTLLWAGLPVPAGTFTASLNGFEALGAFISILFVFILNHLLQNKWSEIVHQRALAETRIDGKDTRTFDGGEVTTTDHRIRSSGVVWVLPRDAWEKVQPGDRVRVEYDANTGSVWQISLMR